jgi:hypothetical protein
MSIKEKVFSSRAVLRVSGSSDGIADAKKFLWCFPGELSAAAEGENWVKQLVASSSRGS